MPQPIQEFRADALSLPQQTGLYALMLLVSLSYNFSFILIDYIRPFLVRDLHMALERTTLLYAVQACGVIFGALFAPPLVSASGSKKVLIVGSLLLAGCTAITLKTADFTTWAIMRFVIGCALSASYIASVTLLANFFPPRMRGRLLAANMSMFSIALMTAGAIGAGVDRSGWKTLVAVAAALPLIVAILTTLFAPSDRAFAVYGDNDGKSDIKVGRGSWPEMLVPGRRSLTLTCLLLAGLNFSGYQFYSGFITTYLLEVRGFNPANVGVFVLIDGLGTLGGSLLWGFTADRWGRRINALGLGTAAVFITLFLIAPPAKALMLALEFGYAVCLSSTNCWAAYFSELFPVRLRPMGTALFHGGHIISMAAPLIVALVARSHSLVAGMSLAPLTFVAAGALWWSLPETLRSASRYRGFNADRPLERSAVG